MKLTTLGILVTCGAFIPSWGFIGDKSWARNFEGHACTNDSSFTERPSFLRSQRRSGCPPETNLICGSSGVCECPAEDLVYAHDFLSCLPVATQDNGNSCVSPLQCQRGSYGRYSTCNSDTGRCDCHNVESKESEKVQLVDGVCYLVHKVIGRELSLAGSQGSHKVTTMELGMPCGTHEECLRSPMRPLSRCNLVDKQCECYDTKTGGKNQVGLLGGRCWVKRSLGEFCEANEECRFGWHTNAECVDGDSYKQGKICACRSEEMGGCTGEVGGGVGGGSGVIVNTGIVLVTSLMLKVMTFLL